MPDRQTHAMIGAITGLGFSTYRARQHQSIFEFLAESLGGSFGGYFGGILPDIIEPSTWPGHRKIAHSVTTAGSVAGSHRLFLRDIEERLRSSVKRYTTRCKQDQANHAILFRSKLLEFGTHFCSGFISGLVAGYISHLALDAVTPKSIPIL